MNSVAALVVDSVVVVVVAVVQCGSMVLDKDDHVDFASGRVLVDNVVGGKLLVEAVVLE